MPGKRVSRFRSAFSLISAALLALAVGPLLIAFPAVGEGGDETPQARGYHNMIYDAHFDRIVLFGGIIVDSTSPDTYRPVADTRALDVSSDHWTRLAPSSHPWLSSTDIAQDEALVGFGPLAYDSESDVLVYFRSIVDDYDDPTPGFEAAPANETWVLPGEKQQWVLKGSGESDAPSAGRFGPRMAYDAPSDRVILFGGWNLSDRTFLSDTWAYDYNTNTWQEMSPPVSPEGRNYHRMVYDSSTDRIILFGGLPSNQVRDGGTWAYDYETDTWTSLNPVVAPSPREYHAMAYDEMSQVIVLFGGVGTGETPNAETWTFDSATNAWTQKFPAVFPSERGWHDMVYSPSAERVILFGGGPDRFHPNDETWAYDFESNTWTPLTRPSTSGLSPLEVGAVSAAGIAIAVGVGALLIRRRRRG